MMELAFQSRGRTKLSESGDKKHWFKRAVAPLIGADLAHRKKQMFTVPVGDWFRTQRYAWLHQLLTGSEMLNTVVEAAELERLLEAHRSGAANLTRELRALAAVALWAQTGVGA
jgi:asparagine synthase (glutamine-hydrolysing)